MIVACVKTGKLYGPEYVNRLAAMVARHTTWPYHFVCLTDDASGLTCPSWSMESADLPGWWSKLILFKPSLFDERVIYLDLDTVIVGNVDFLFDYAGPFCILRDFYRPTGYGSAVMSIAPGFGRHIWERFTPDVMARLHGDQNWIEEQVSGADRWQDVAPGEIISYKADNVATRGVNGASIVCMHGTPKQTDLLPTDPIRLAWEAA